MNKKTNPYKMLRQLTKTDLVKKACRENGFFKKPSKRELEKLPVYMRIELGKSLSRLVEDAIFQGNVRPSAKNWTNPFDDCFTVAAGFKERNPGPYWELPGQEFDPTR